MNQNQAIDREHFLKNNKLANVLPAFVDQDITIEELLEFSAADLISFSQDIGLNTIQKNRLVKAIGKLKASNHQNNIINTVNNDNDIDQKFSDAYSNELEVIRRKMQKLTIGDTDAINVHHNIVNTQIASLLFNTKIEKYKSANTLDVSFDNLKLAAPIKIAQELKALHVIKSMQDAIVESVMGKVELCLLTKDNQQDDVSKKWYINLDHSWGGKSYIGLIIFGFVPSMNKNRIKLVSVGHCEEWQVSFWNKLKTNIDQNHIKNYILAQMLDQLGIQRQKQMGLKYVSTDICSPTKFQFKDNDAPSSAIEPWCSIQ